MPELGHGVFKLEHPWEQYGTTKGATNLLMDYSQGTVLNHQDWKQINDLVFKLYVFQSQASGQEVSRDFVLKEDSYFLTPSNKLIKLAKGTQILFTCDKPQSHLNGALFSFKTPDGFLWHDTTKFALNDKTFDGYFKADKNGWVKDKGALIAYSDVSFKYNQAGKYTIYFINLLTSNNGKNEYRILKQEVQLTAQQISANSNFTGAIQDLVYKNEGLVDTIISTGCETKPEEEKGTYITAIDSKDKKAVLKIYQNTITKKFTVEAELKGEGNEKTKKQKVALEKKLSDLATQKINELGGLNEHKSKPFFETTDDGGGFYVKDMNGEQWLGTICDLGSNVWQNATLPENYWNQDDAGFKDSTIHLPPTLSGVSDGAIDLVSDYPQLINLAYDVATKEEVRTGIWEGIKNVSVDKVIDFAEGAVEDKWNKYNNSKPFITYHELGYDAVGVVKMVTAGGLVAGLKDTGEKFSKKSITSVADLVKDVVAKRANIRKVLDIDAGKVYAKKYFDNIVKDGNFEDWWAKAKRYDVNDDLNFEVHHVIPIKVFEKNSKLQEVLFWAEQNNKKFDFNSIDNGIPLQKKKAAIDLNGHTNHPKYDDVITNKLIKITESKILDNEEKFEAIKNLIEKTKNKLESEVLLGNKDVNQITDF